MVGRLHDSVLHGARRYLADSTPEVLAASSELHHIEMGPGPSLEAEWMSAGLRLPDLDEMRRYRHRRILDQLDRLGYDAIIVMDPLNIRYATDSTNMQLWVMHNAARYAWIGADGSVIVWEFFKAEFLAAHNELVTEIRPAIGSTVFIAGSRFEEKAHQWAAEMLDVIREHCGDQPRIAIDQCHHIGYQDLEAAGISIGNGQEVMEAARAIKGPDEIAAMRCAVNACESSMADMRAVMKPGMTEREVWSVLHGGNIARAGEWIETQIFASGPRTNPWMQEASSRIIEAGDVVAYDTDLVGAYGMMCDISRSWIAGDVAPSPAQQSVYDLAFHQINMNLELLTPGRTFRELTFDSWMPPPDEYRHYCVMFHGVGQCDEWPEIVFPHMWEEWGHDGVLEPGMVMTVEAYVGSVDGGEGIKLEEQVLITETGYEQLSTYPLGLT